MSQWLVFTGNIDGTEKNAHLPLPPPPPWRDFTNHERDTLRGTTLHPNPHAIQMVNIAMYLRRPLLITGKPGTGKSSLAYAVAEELQLGNVLTWSINTRSSLQDGLYRYDAIARLRDAQITQTTSQTSTEQAQDIARYIRLGPLGTALLANDRPRVLLIDEIDKSDIDLPNDLLNVFEEGTFLIPELTLQRVARDVESIATSNPVSVQVMSDDDQLVAVTDGRVRCREFPLVIMTSNNERDFPPAFLRRCIRLELAPPSPDELATIVNRHFAHLTSDQKGQLRDLINDFDRRRKQPNQELATDQLLNLVFLLTQDIEVTDEIKTVILQSLNAGF